MKTIILASEMTGCFTTISGLALERARGRSMLFVPTAARGEGWEPDYETDILPFERLGFDVTVFDLAEYGPAATERALETAAFVFVGGGNTFHLLHHMKRSGFFDTVRRRVGEGLVYAGSSAGAVAASPDIAYAATVDDPSRGGDLGTGGLAFVDRPVLPHMNHPSFAPHVRAIADGFEARGIPYYGLDDDQAVVVEDDGPRLLRASASIPSRGPH